MKGIADTGLIVAFGKRSDYFHDWAVEVAKSITEPLLTCEAVLTETAFRSLGKGSPLGGCWRASTSEPCASGCVSMARHARFEI